MGLSASQARFLMLTARKSNIEFEIQQTTQAKLNLANNQDTEALLWSNGMNVQHLYYSATGSGSPNESLPRLNYQRVTTPLKDGGLEMRVVDQYGRMVVSKLPEPMPEGMDIQNYVIERDCTQADYFENKLKTAEWIIQEPDARSEEGWRNITLQGSEFIYQGIDAKDYQIAAADYDQTVAKLENVDKRFDMRIQYLSNEQKAIETEMDSVKKVIDKNIEETFKTFG